MNLVALAGGGVCYNLFDSGLANLLGVETLNHGTNGFNYLSIHVFGGDPATGGKSTGSTKNFCGDVTNDFFYMFKDSEWSTPANPDGVLALIPQPFLAKHLLPRMHCFLSGYNFNARLLPESDSTLISYTKIFFGVVGGFANLLFVPTLHFRFSKIDPKRLKADPAYGNGGVAYRTTQKVEAWRLGVMGTILTGVNFDWFSRAKANPLKVATGIVQLTCAVALTILMVKQLSEVMAICAIAGALCA